jgi:hypothetical protein
VRITTSTLRDEESQALANNLADILARRRGAYTA